MFGAHVAASACLRVALSVPRLRRCLYCYCTATVSACRYRADLDALHRKRGSCAKRWDAAYRVLHQELAAAKARMAEFVQQLQQEQMQQQQAAGAGSASGALPAVRVK